VAPETTAPKTTAINDDDPIEAIAKATKNQPQQLLRVPSTLEEPLEITDKTEFNDALRDRYFIGSGTWKELQPTIKKCQEVLQSAQQTQKPDELLRACVTLLKSEIDESYTPPENVNSLEEERIVHFPTFKFSRIIFSNMRYERGGTSNNPTRIVFPEEFNLTNEVYTLKPNAELKTCCAITGAVGSKNAISVTSRTPVNQCQIAATFAWKYSWYPCGTGFVSVQFYTSKAEALNEYYDTLLKQDYDCTKEDKGNTHKWNCKSPDGNASWRMENTPIPSRGVKPDVINPLARLIDARKITATWEVQTSNGCVY
jgi:hypothetical protein